MASKGVTGCMIIIGNEILSGRTQDTNLNDLAKALNEVGLRLRWEDAGPTQESGYVTSFDVVAYDTAGSQAARAP